jgi:hypothetical protein
MIFVVSKSAIPISIYLIYSKYWSNNLVELEPSLSGFLGKLQVPEVWVLLE